MAELVLASSSPRRARLLTAAGLEFAIAPTKCDETWHPGEDPESYALRLAEQKAGLATAEAAARGRSPLVLAADTVVWLRRDEPPLGKPADKVEAAAMLTRLTAGEPHYVTTGFAVFDARTDPATQHTGAETTKVWMRSFVPGELQTHIDTKQWRDKAGGYGIQDLAASLVTRIEGSYTNVVGLPVAQVVSLIHGLRQPSESTP